MSKIIEKVTAFIIRKSKDGNDLLLFEHPNAGIQIPAGTVEDQETPEKAIIREVAEETGLTGSINLNDNIVCIGENNGATGRYFKGWMNDVRIYNRAWSVAEAQAFHTTQGGDDNVEGLLARFLCDEGAPGTTASTLQDSTGANNATGSGSPTFTESPHFGTSRRSA